MNFWWKLFSPELSNITGLKIMAGQQTMSGLIVDLTGQTLVLLVILTGHFWMRTFYNIFHIVAA